MTDKCIVNSYDKVFDRCVRSRFNELPAGEQHLYQNRRGDLDPNAPFASNEAVYDTYNYQRSHADAFIEAACEVNLEFTDGLTRVIDLGAGAGTVAVALGELWGADVESVRYVGVEPTKMMRELGTCIVEGVDAPWQSFRFVPSVDYLPPVKGSRILVTLSYLVHQSAISDDDIAAWAGLIRDCALVADTEILITTANTSELKWRDRSHDLLKRLAGLGVSVSKQEHHISVPAQFPKKPQGWGPPVSKSNNVRVLYWRTAGRAS